MIMGWGIQFEPTIFISRESVSNKSDIDYHIEDAQSSIDYAEKKIRELVMYCPKYEEMADISIELTDMLEYLRDSVVKRERFEALKDYVDDHKDIDFKKLNT